MWWCIIDLFGYTCPSPAMQWVFINRLGEKTNLYLTNVRSLLVPKLADKQLQTDRLVWRYARQVLINIFSVVQTPQWLAHVTTPWPATTEKPRRPSAAARFKRICHIHPNGRDYLKAVGGVRKLMGGPMVVRGSSSPGGIDSRMDSALICWNGCGWSTYQPLHDFLWFTLYYVGSWKPHFDPFDLWLIGAAVDIL